MYSNTLTVLRLGACVLLLLLHSASPAQASSVKDVATAYIAELNALFFFGGWDERTPIITTAGYINLTAPFSVDSPPITTIPSVPIPTSRLVPLVVKNAIGDSFDIIVAGGITPSVPFQVGSFLNGVTAWTYSITNTNGGAQQPSIRVSVNGGRNTDGLPYGPASQYATTTAEGLFGNAHAFGGRQFPTPFFNQLKVLDRSGAFSTVLFNNNSAPAPRADSQLARVNSTHLIVAGGDMNATKYTDIWLFNIQQPSWTRYPHALLQFRAFGAIVSYAAPSGNRYIILIGRELPLIEYFNLSANGLPQAIDPTGQGPATMEQPSAVMVGDQMVIIGGFSKTGDANQRSDQRFFRVLKVKESDGSKLSFEWQNSFTPIAKANSAADSPSSPSGPTVAGDEERKPAGWTLALIISGSLLGIFVIAASLFLIRRRRRDRKSSATRAHHQNPDRAASQQPIVMPVAPTATAGEASRLIPMQPADVMYPLAPSCRPPSSVHDQALFSKSGAPGATLGPPAHLPANRALVIGPADGDEVMYLPQPRNVQQQSPNGHDADNPFETLILPPLRPAQPVDSSGTPLLPAGPAQASVAGVSAASFQMNQPAAGQVDESSQPPRSSVGTFYLPNDTGNRVVERGHLNA
ncbi:hypothetical protein BCR44DRAFT_27214 [Catenaria anguillulae PL171]|uniref:Uncharacterized protein n=1 Tax=Catenaria anguillulae PL171 TaxID=765915 RepID=A0A1Y2HRS2_9FUNG|nr:hypothetical protein BCR44DRAFT_27214 [Catenaria anguillulae PL171]